MQTAAALLALVAALGALTVLARTQEQGAATKPAAGTQVSRVGPPAVEGTG